MGFVALQSFLLLREDEKDFIRLIKKERPRGKWLPDAEDDHYTFLGEIPWSDTFSRSAITSIDFVIRNKRIRAVPSDPHFALNVILDFGTSKHTIRSPKGPVFERVNVYRKIPVYLPVRQKSFAPHAGVESAGCLVPAKEIAELFGLWVGLPNCNFRDQTGNICSIVTRDGTLGDYESHLYLKQDLVDRLLSSQELSLVWVVWGERQHLTSHFAPTNTPSHGYRVFQQAYRYRDGSIVQIK